MNDEQTMKDKIAKAIEENLPNQVGKLLQKKLADADLTEVRHKTLIEEHKDVKRELKISDNEVKRLGALEAKNADLTKWEEELGTQQRQQKQEILEIKLKEANTRADVVTNFVSLLMKNPQAITSIFTHFNQGCVDYDRDGRPIYKHPDSSNADITTTNEKP